MIKAEVKEGVELCVSANYDSGTLKGFECFAVINGNPYEMRSLDKILTKEHIRVVEMVIATTVTQIVNG